MWQRLASIVTWIAAGGAVLTGIAYLWLTVSSLRYATGGDYVLGLALLVGTAIELSIPFGGLWLIRMGQPWSISIGAVLGVLSLGLTVILVVLIPVVAFGIGNP